MRLSFVALSALVAVASASSSIFARQADFPTCALACITGADLGGCAQTDTKCLCTTPKFVSDTTSCIQSGCSGGDLQNALKAAQALCLSAGVTLTASDAASATTPATTDTLGLAASTPAASSPAASSPAASSPAASAPAASSPASASSKPASSAGTSPSASSPAASPPATGNGAISNGFSALAGMAALGLAAFAL